MFARTLLIFINYTSEVALVLLSFIMTVQTSRGELKDLIHTTSWKLRFTENRAN